MSSIQEFVCDGCTLYWRDKYSFWNVYQSACPQCGKLCGAVCDTQMYADQQEMAGLYNGPLFNTDDEDFEQSEADLEGERDLIRDEIVEALGAIESETGQAHEDSDTDEDANGDAGGDRP
jgi:hypothetical protein